MIEYEYRCSVCKHQFSTMQSIKDKPLERCPACGQWKLERLIFGGMPPIVRGEPTTVGQLAERNTKKMGKLELAEKRRLHKQQRVKAKSKIIEESGGKQVDVPTERKTPIYGKVDHEKIAKMTPEQKKRYILEGK